MAEGRFSNGFLLGLVIGGGLVFLLGTDSGKRILKTISEEGLENLTTFLEDLDIEDLEEEIPDEVEEARELSKEPNPEKVEEVHKEEITEEKTETKTEAKPSKKRFFRKK